MKLKLNGKGTEATILLHFSAVTHEMLGM